MWIHLWELFDIRPIRSDANSQLGVTYFYKLALYSYYKVEKRNIQNKIQVTLPAKIEQREIWR